MVFVNASFQLSSSCKSFHLMDRAYHAPYVSMEKIYDKSTRWFPCGQGYCWCSICVISKNLKGKYIISDESYFSVPKPCRGSRNTYFLLLTEFKFLEYKQDKISNWYFWMYAFYSHLFLLSFHLMEIDRVYPPSLDKIFGKSSGWHWLSLKDLFIWCISICVLINLTIHYQKILNLNSKIEISEGK